MYKSLASKGEKVAAFVEPLMKILDLETQAGEIQSMLEQTRKAVFEWTRILRREIKNNGYTTGDLLLDYAIMRFDATIWPMVLERLEFIQNHFMALRGNLIMLVETDTDDKKIRDIHIGIISGDKFIVKPAIRQCAFPTNGYTSLLAGAEKCTSVEWMMGEDGEPKWDVRALMDPHHFEPMVREMTLEVIFGEAEIAKWAEKHRAIAEVSKCLQTLRDGIPV